MCGRGTLSVFVTWTTLTFGTAFPPSDVSDEELNKRRQRWSPPPPRYERGYGKLFANHIGQADTGCDFDFLEDGSPTPEPEIH